MTLWTVACQAPLSMKFPRHGYWSGLPHPAAGTLPTQGRNPCLLHLLDWQAGSLAEALKISLNNAAAATAAKSLQSCPTLCDPIDGSPPGSPVPGILQARTLEWVAIKTVISQ